jgi:hypothetical protein
VVVPAGKSHWVAEVEAEGRQIVHVCPGKCSWLQLLNEEEGSDNSVFHYPTPNIDLFAVSDVFPNTVWVF